VEFDPICSWSTRNAFDLIPAFWDRRVLTQPFSHPVITRGGKLARIKLTAALDPLHARVETLPLTSSDARTQEDGVEDDDKTVYCRDCSRCLWTARVWNNARARSPVRGVCVVKVGLTSLGIDHPAQSQTNQPDAGGR